MTVQLSSFTDEEMGTSSVLKSCSSKRQNWASIRFSCPCPLNLCLCTHTSNTGDPCAWYRPATFGGLFSLSHSHAIGIAPSISQTLSVWLFHDHSFSWLLCVGGLLISPKLESMSHCNHFEIIYGKVIKTCDGLMLTWHLEFICVRAWRCFYIHVRPPFRHVSDLACDQQI